MSRRRWLILPVLLVMLSMSIASCSSSLPNYGTTSSTSSTSSTRSTSSPVSGQRTVAAVHTTLNLYISDLLAGNGQAGCQLLTKATAARVGDSNKQHSCVIAFAGEKSTFTGKDKPSAAKVAQVKQQISAAPITITGNTATAKLGTDNSSVTLVYEKNHWLIQF